MTSQSRLSVVVLGLTLLVGGLIARLLVPSAPAQSPQARETSASSADIVTRSAALSSVEQGVGADGLAPTVESTVVGTRDPMREVDPTLVVLVVAEESGRPHEGIEVTVSRRRPRGEDLSAGPALAGLNVEAVPSSTSPNSVTVSTDATGIAVFRVGAGLDLDASVYESRSQDVLPPRPETVRVPSLAAGERRQVTVPLRTRPDAFFDARIVDAADDSPIVGARVELTEKRGSFGDPVLLLQRRSSTKKPLSEQVSDAAGFCRFECASWQSQTLRIDAEGYCLAELVLVGDPREGRRRLETIRIPRSARLLARVVGAAEGPLPGISIRVGGATSKRHAARQAPEGRISKRATRVSTWERVTATDGTATFDDLPTGYLLGVELSGRGRTLEFDPGHLELAPAEVREVTFEFSGATAVAGTLLDRSGRALPGETLWLARAEEERASWFGSSDQVFGRATTNELGRFRFEGVPSGTWRVGPAARELKSPSRDILRMLAPATELVVVPAAGEVEVLLLADRGLSIRGLVIDVEGRAVHQAHVQAELAGGTGRSAVSDERGNFLIGPLAAGEYRLSATSDDSLLGRRSTRGSVFARAGEAEVVLRLEPVPRPR